MIFGVIGGWWGAHKLLQAESYCEEVAKQKLKAKMDANKVRCAQRRRRRAYPTTAVAPSPQHRQHPASAAIDTDPGTGRSPLSSFAVCAGRARRQVPRAAGHELREILPRLALRELRRASLLKTLLGGQSRKAPLVQVLAAAALRDYARETRMREVHAPCREDIF